MVPAKLKQTTITIRNQNQIFALEDKLLFPWLCEFSVEGQDNPELDLANKERVPPNLSIAITL